MFDDPSRSGCADRISFRADHRASGSVSVWQADRELSGTGALGRFQWEPATARAHHQTGEFDVALLVGGSCPSYGTKHSAMARRLAIALYWMWRKGWDYERVKKFGSHAGQLEPGHGVQSNTE